MPPSSEKFYDRLTLLYPVIDLFLRPQKRMFFNLVNSCPPGQLLEIGIGNGTHFNCYSAHQVTGIDTSKKMLAQAAKRVKNNIKLIHMNGEALAFPNATFDYVVLSHVIAVVNDPEKVLHEVNRVLKPQGKVFILNHFTPNNALKHIDKTFATITRLLYFKSVFRVADLHTLKNFNLLRESNAGLFSYFKILIYEKKL